MNFQNLHSIEPADFFIDLAFRSAKKRSSLARASAPGGDRVKKSRYIETVRIETVAATIIEKLSEIESGFPVIESLPDFYQKLADIALPCYDMKRALSGIKFAVAKIRELRDKTKNTIKKGNVIELMNSARREFYGRVNSIMEDLDPHLALLERSRKIMKDFPTIKTDAYTVTITGFPNVGKTTLLAKLTGSSPNIQPYAFTTKGINVGYARVDGEKVQFLDTPGTLNRFNRMNFIEKQSYLAIQLLAQFVVYVFDVTEASAPLEAQVRLYGEVKEKGIPMMVYLAKSDVAKKEILAEFKKKYNAATLPSEVLVSVSQRFSKK